jgi:hypothetical protein
VLEQSFTQRFGLAGKPITDGFPKDATVSLAYLFGDMVEQGYVDCWDAVFKEIGRYGGIPEIGPDWVKPVAGVVNTLEDLEWHKIYSLCEGVYKRLLQAPGFYGGPTDDQPEWVSPGNMEDAQSYFEKEMNDLLARHNLGYEFRSGRFQRRGRPQMQQSLQRAGAVLSQPRFERVLIHYNKARRFFDQRPDPDAQNTVKEAVCALEACLQIACGRTLSSDMPKLLKQLEGNGPNQIPPTIAQILAKLYAYRGDGQGVAHAALGGSKVGSLEAELVLGIVASSITYLADLYPETEEAIPF